MAAVARDDSRLYIADGLGSNYGPCVAVWAPGQDILSASSAGDDCSEFRSGTSQAVPFAAGAIALYLQNASGNSHKVINLKLTQVKISGTSCGSRTATLAGAVLWK